ncbi:MAG: GNAT family N-acetyltransferase [Anaerolineae bacterium]
MGLSQWLLNTPPTPGAPFVLDKDGRKYWATWHNPDIRPSLALSHRGAVVAHVYMEWGPKGLIIVDIVIDKPAYKKRGLGTVLLDEVTGFAKGKGIKLITGLIPRKDCEEDPHLLEWYRRRGFQVQPSDDPRWGAEISKDLTQPPQIIS